MASITTSIETWLFSTLSGDATLATLPGGVWAHLAKQGETTPYLIYRTVDNGGNDLNTLGGVRGVSERFYDVFVVSKDTGFVEIDPFAVAIDALLQGVTTDEDPRFYIERVDEIHSVEMGSGGIKIYESGGRYRFLVTPES